MGGMETGVDVVAPDQAQGTMVEGAEGAVKQPRQLDRPIKSWTSLEAMGFVLSS